MDRPGARWSRPGALGINGATLPNEKELDIGVASYLENDLAALGYYVYKTRNSDTTFLYPVARRRIANGERANDQGLRASCRLFISIHMNSWGDPATLGTETYYATSKYDAKRKYAYRADSSAAKGIHADLMTYANVAFLFCSRDRGIKPKNYDVLMRTRPAALLFEVCFVSNACQFNHITSSGNQAIIAEGIAAGVSGYLGSFLESPLPRQTEPPIAVTSGQTAHAIAASLQEDFEGAAFPPTGWTIQTAGLALPHAWHRTTDSLYVGNGSASALVGGESPGAIDEWLISPAVSLVGANRAIKFSWSGSQIWSNVLNASLSIRVAGTFAWTPLWSIANDEPPADPFIYRERVVDLSAWIGSNVEFGFRVVGTNGADFALDDIVVGDFSPTVAAPNDVCASAIRLGSVFSIQGVTCYAANDLNPFTTSPSSCIGDELDGPDVFYEIGAGLGDSLHASVTAEWGAALYIVDDCVNPICLAGAYAEDGRTAPILDYKFSTTGSYYLVVDGEEGSCGPYQLDGQIIHTATGVIGDATVPPLSLVVHPNPAGGPISLFAALSVSQRDAPILEIYDVAGKRVLRIEGASGSREFSFVWDRRDKRGMPVASGVYFARLQIGRQAVMQKFIILR